MATALLNRVRELADGGLTSRDIFMSWMERQLLPLRHRSHKMCFTSGPNDPNRLSRSDATFEEVKAMLHTIAPKEVITELWQYALPPYTRQNRPPRVRSGCLA